MSNTRRRIVSALILSVAAILTGWSADTAHDHFSRPDTTATVTVEPGEVWWTTTLDTPGGIDPVAYLTHFWK